MRGAYFDWEFILIQQVVLNPKKVWAGKEHRKGIERHLNDTFGMVSSVLCVWDFLRLKTIDDINDADAAEVVTFVMHTFQTTGCLPSSPPHPPSCHTFENSWCWENSKNSQSSIYQTFSSFPKHAFIWYITFGVREKSVGHQFCQLGWKYFPLHFITFCHKEKLYIFRKEQ